MSRPITMSRPPPPARRRASGLIAAVCIGLWPLPALAAASDPEAFGRLFFTPAQRSQLDRARLQPAATVPVPREVAGDPAPRAAPVPPPAAGSVSVDGIVRRSDGRATVWVNGQPTLAPQQSGAIRIGPVQDAADGADLRLPDSGRQVRIKVGQEVDVQSGRIEERYRQAPAPDAAVDKPGVAEHASPAVAGSVEPDAASAAASRETAFARRLRELERRIDGLWRDPLPDGAPRSETARPGTGTGTGNNAGQTARE